MPVDTNPEDVAAAQENLTSTELVFDPVDQASPGSYTSAFGTSYQIPRTPNVGRYVDVVGFTGTFSPQVAVSELAQLNDTFVTGAFKSVPPGPHGGLMECASEYGNEECIFGTSTTLGQFLISDTLNELTGANTAANAIRIRDALEVPAS
jgi:hypothetical protein